MKDEQTARPPPIGRRIPLCGMVPRAVRDLNGIHAYIGLFAPQAADRFTARLIAAVESLAEQPNRGRSVGRFRELVAVSPYVVRYRVKARAVEIIRIRHGARPPD